MDVDENAGDSSEASNHPKGALLCFLHENDEQSGRVGKVLPFGTGTLSKCREILVARQTHNLKYRDVVLPDESSKTVGYHSSCYSKFTAISKRKSSETTDSQMFPPPRPTRSTSSDNLTSAGNRTFLKVCLFCENETKKIKGVRYKLSKCEFKSDPSDCGIASSGIGTRCCLHIGEGASEGEIHTFSKELLAKCKIFKYLRNKYACPLGDVTLPKTVDGDEGVHNRCFKTFANFTDDISSESSFQNNVKMYAMVLDDERMLAKVSGVDFLAREVWYHPICRSTYQSRVDIIIKKAGDDAPSDWHECRKVHAEVFAAICAIVEDSVISNSEVYFVSELTTLYRSILDERGLEDEVTFTTQHLEKKLLKQFGDKIKLDKGNKRKGNIIYKTGMDLDQVIRSAFDMKRQLSMRSSNLAFELRKCIFDSPKTPLGEELKMEDILRGEISIPDSLLQFVTQLVQGPDPRRGHTEIKHRRIESLCQDLMYAVVGGRWKPRKHIMLGLALKKLTSSRKIIEILNRLCHCISYTSIEELETELTIQLNDEKQVTPFGMRLEPGPITGVAWDNYDRYVCTLTGKNTLHDTVGIAYQDLQEPGVTDVDDLLDSHSAHPAVVPGPSGTQSIKKSLGFKRRRAYEARGTHIEPYRKKPKISNLLFYSSDHPERHVVPKSYETAKLKDLLWILSLKFMPQTPMWVGWNSVFSIPQERNQKQEVWYLPQINASPTSYTVVAETLKRSIKIANETRRETLSVTADLAVAKMMVKLQQEESPTYDRLFINFGAFHIEMAFFHAIGKYIELSGGPSILSMAGLISSDSLNGFIKGTHFNRCKRIHPIFYAALKTLHFEEFMLKSNTDIDLLKEDLLALIPDVISGKDIDILPAEILDICNAYNSFTEETKQGTHGLTAQYWIQYMYMIELYQDLSRSVREGDFELFVHTIPKISGYFFVFNQPNYARWMTLYHNNLLRLEETHSDVYIDFKNGGFGVKRTDKSFSRSPVDLTLEQTINADAASQRTGIAAFTNSISARQRWAHSHYISMTVITHLLEDLGLTNKDDVTQELKPSVIERNSQDRVKLETAISESMNPFSSNVEKKYLYNIETGKAASSETADFLLNTTAIGLKAQDSFIDSCCSDDNVFNKSVKRQKLKTFASEGAKVKKNAAKGKIVEIKMERNLFGKLLCMALEKEMDLKEILKFPLTPIPLSLCHFDGTIRSTSKSELMNHLKKRIVPLPPPSVDLYIIDGNFFLHLLTDLPLSFGKISQQILYSICNITTCRRVDIVFDQYLVPSIKGYERQMRGDDDGCPSYVISGPEQRRPNNFSKALRNPHFKTALIHYLVESWHDDALIHILGNKTLFATCDDKCYSFCARNDRMLKLEVISMRCPAEEADTKMLFHAASFLTPANIVIRTFDTDVLCITLGIRKHLAPDCRIWLEIGHYTNNSLEYVDIQSIYENLGEKLCDALPALHIFTGSDFTAAFNKKGKVRPFQLLEKNEDIQDAFASLGYREEVDASMEALIEKFVCIMYRQPKKIVTVADARFNYFVKSYKMKKDEFDSIKGCDASSMPLSLPVLKQKLKRTNKVMSVWKFAHLQNTPHTFATEDNGWHLIDEDYVFNWFDGDANPPLPQLPITGDDDNDDIDDIELYQSESDIEDVEYD